MHCVPLVVRREDADRCRPPTLDFNVNNAIAGLGNDALSILKGVSSTDQFAETALRIALAQPMQLNDRVHVLNVGHADRAKSALACATKTDAHCFHLFQREVRHRRSATLGEHGWSGWYRAQLGVATCKCL